MNYNNLISSINQYKIKKRTPLIKENKLKETELYFNAYKDQKEVNI